MKRRTPHFSRPAFGSFTSLCLLAGLWSSPVHAQAPASDDVEIKVEAAPAAPVTPAVAPLVAPAPPAPVAAAAPSVSTAEVDKFHNDLAALAARVDAAESAEREASTKLSALETQEAAESKARVQADLLSRAAALGVSLSGYLQVQYSRNELSEDQLLQGGSALNQNRFAVRRGRLRLNGRWKYARSDFELDGSNTRGPAVSVRRASLSGVLPGASDKEPPPLLLTVGLTEIPLGLELQQGQDEILFLERTTGSLAFFAGPVDTGGKLEAAYGPLRAQLAIMNGVPLDDRAGGPSAVDPTNAPDYLGRIGIDLKPLETLQLAAGTSFLSGKGFHPGSDATKGVLLWDDKNGDGQFSTTEVVQAAGRGALPSTKFDRWAVGVDLSIDLSTKLGHSKLYGEVLLASNLDRALYVADPTLSGSDIRELNWYAALVQDVTEYAFVGLRYDAYDPNSDLIDNRRGQVIPEDATITTVSPILGLRVPNVARLTFQYDFVDDQLGRDVRGVPTDVANNQWTLRAQGQF